MIARITSGQSLIVKVQGGKSSVDLGSQPIQITLCEDTKFVNKLYNTQAPNDAFDIAQTAKELGYNEEQFKLFMQRMLLYHEVGHILFTPAKTPTHPDPVMKMLVNYVEDARIESKVSAHYPPTRNRIHLLNRLLLSNINLDKAMEGTLANPDKRNVVMLATAIAGHYFYNLSDKQPMSPAVTRMVEIQNELWDNSKTTFKHTQKFAEELFNLIPGLTMEQLAQEIANLKSGSGNGLNSLDEMREGVEDDLNEGMQDFVEDLKAYGIEMKNRDLRQLQTIKYLDYELVNYLYQTLKRIIGGKPSKQNVIDYEGFAIDVEGLLEWQNDPSREIKMMERAGKREKPELYITMCIDSSGSMSGGQIEVAKKSAINLAYACEKLGIKTCILDFATDVAVHKTFEQPIKESKIGELVANGGTDISCAIEASCKLMGREIMPPSARCATIVLSDGCDGSAKRVGMLLDQNKHNHFYMVGIHDNPERYVVEVRNAGGNCYGHVYIQDMKMVMRGMSLFTKDFVKRC